MHSNEPTHSRGTVEALWPALHPIHEVDAVLAGDRATPTTNSCAGNRDKAPREEMLTISGANWFGRRAGTCRLHAIYDQSWIYVGKVNRCYGSAEPATRSHTSAIASISARACSVDNVCAVARHSWARRRNSSVLVRVMAIPIGQLPFQSNGSVGVPRPVRIFGFGRFRSHTSPPRHARRFPARAVMAVFAESWRRK
jgi:hypothetical protein